jgi:two-component sensor histidine kinase
MIASRVLIVDDDHALLDALPRMLRLRMEPLFVDTADSARPALEQIAAVDYDAIVTDIKMPGMDGLALLGEIRALRPSTPTLLITGHGEDDLAIQALRGGAYDFIQKPIDREYLIAALKRAIDLCRLSRQVQAQNEALESHAAKLEKIVEERTRDLVELNQRLQRAVAETHHRVKNNLQVISALIDMQVLRGQRTVPISEFERLGQHVRTLATIHDILTQRVTSGSESGFISAKEALEKLMPMIESMTNRRSVHFDIEEVMLPARHSTSVCVLVNELVSNAFKHGDCCVHVNLKVNHPLIRLTVANGGPGFPPNFDSCISGHTGLELVRNISRWDLKGNVIFESPSEGGARVTVEFPAPNESR